MYNRPNPSHETFYQIYILLLGEQKGEKRSICLFFCCMSEIATTNFFPYFPPPPPPPITHSPNQQSFHHFKCFQINSDTYLGHACMNLSSKLLTTIIGTLLYSRIKSLKTSQVFIIKFCLCQMLVLCQIYKSCCCCVKSIRGKTGNQIVKISSLKGSIFEWEDTKEF